MSRAQTVSSSPRRTVLAHHTEEERAGVEEERAEGERTEVERWGREVEREGWRMRVIYDI